MYKISIIDDHPMVIEGIATIFQEQKKYELSGSFSNIEELKRAFKDNIPDILLLDLQLPDGKGIYLADELIHDFPQLKIIVITSMDQLYIVKEMLSKGCRGYLVKSECHIDDVFAALDKVIQGGIYLSQNINQQLMNDLLNREEKYKHQNIHLSIREKEIIQLISLEYTSKEIAEKLSISLSTVQGHRYCIFNKLNVSNLPQLYEAAKKLGII